MKAAKPSFFFTTYVLLSLAAPLLWSAPFPPSLELSQTGTEDLGSTARTAYLRSLGLSQRGDISGSYDLLSRALEMWPDDEDLINQYETIRLQYAMFLLGACRE